MRQVSQPLLNAWAFFLLGFVLMASPLWGARDLLDQGQYEEAVEGLQENLREDPRNPLYYEQMAEALAATGDINAAGGLLASALQRGVSPYRIRWAMFELIRMIEPTHVALRVLPSVRMIKSATFEDPEARVAAGRSLLQLGADPKQVLNEYFRVALEEAKQSRAAHLAIAELALAKQDNQLAAETLRDALRHYPNDPELHLFMAQAVGPVAPETADDHLRRASEQNPRHPGLLLFLAEQALDQRDFEEAEEVLEALEGVNPDLPELGALRSVIATLNGREDAAAEYRETALKDWPDNPAVDHLIGRKLTQHYRFQEGIDHLQEAQLVDRYDATITLDLGMALLRYARDEAGWEAIESVREADPYNLIAYNLMELRDRIETFITLEREGIRLRMDPASAEVYGVRALDLLVEARETLSEKYGVSVPYPITVEIFADQSDFAVRTFAMPGGEGFLGVCFGPLITAAGPGSSLGRNNWEAVLWHEVGHTITLVATRHRIPRWLTEGLSVYEERQRDPRWGNRLTPGVARTVLQGEMPPLEDLDQAFREGDINTAYYYASWIVEALIAEKGKAGMHDLLRRIGSGMSPALALEMTYGDLETLNETTAAFVVDHLKETAGNWDWTAPEPEAFAAFDEEPEAWVAEHPKSLWGRTYYARRLAESDEWEAVIEMVEPVVDSGLYLMGFDGPHGLLARALRSREETAAEKEVLQEIIERDADALWARIRLLELIDEPAAVRHQLADEMLAIDPMSQLAWRVVGESARQMDQPIEAAAAFLTLLTLDPPDTGRLHLALADLLQESQPVEAKRHLLQAIEASPRNRAAYRRLLEMEP